MHIDLLCVKQLTFTQQFSLVTPCCLFVAFTNWIKVKRGCGCGRSHRNYGNVESLPFTKIHILCQACVKAKQCWKLRWGLGVSYVRAGSAAYSGVIPKWPDSKEESRSDQEIFSLSVESVKMKALFFNSLKIMICLTVIYHTSAWNTVVKFSKFVPESRESRERLLGRFVTLRVSKRPYNPTLQQTEFGVSSRSCVL